jgi:UDP-3-O-[3-hydroxymyristoyl] glucosamine N-acyltransferase
MEFTAEKIADLIGGTVNGDKNATVSTLSKIEEGEKGSLSFLSNPKYTPFIYETNATIVIVKSDLHLEKSIKETCTLIKVDDPYGAFAKLMEVYQGAKNAKNGIEQPSFISQSAKHSDGLYLGAFAYVGENVTIGKNVKIYPHCYIGDNTIIGDNCTFHSGVKIYYETVIGNHCTFHSGSVIGSDGFGFAPNSENNYMKIPQLGNTIIEDYVEIGANSAVDRATMGSTIIRKGVKLDNFVQVGHNSEVGENTVIAGSTSLAGTAKVGKNVMIGGHVAVAGHLSIADGVKVAGMSGVAKTVKEENKVLLGAPFAFDKMKYQRCFLLFKELPKMEERLRNLEKKNN